MLNKKLKIFILVLLILASAAGSFFYLLSKGGTFKGSYKDTKDFKIEAGEGSATLA